MANSNPKIPFHPVLSGWFAETFGEPTDVQKQAWQAIAEGRHTLIAAPTGSGKTLAALLPCLDRVVRAKSDPSRREAAGVRILYITPLKALNNDIHHHALGFVEQLQARAEASGAAWPGIRSEVRTGDTSASKRAAILRRPPELLVTTPESLYLLLTSEKGRAILAAVEQVIVDEIHDVAADKRGAHLSLSLERLERLGGRPVQRIGVSATQNPLERVARFLGGWEPGSREEAGAGHGTKATETQRDTVATKTGRSTEEAGAGRGMETAGQPEMKPRPVAIVESRMSKSMSVSITMPDQSQPAATREAVWLPLLDRIMKEMEGCRSVLLFVNSRRLCERLCLRLNDHVGYEMARSHHGSISRERRLEVERMLKEGSLCCIVATSSLELGIDVGHIDLVIQLDSPLEASRGIQRIGRAGHAVGEASRGLLLARQKAVLPELAVLGRLIARREIEEIRIPEAPLDVLTQHIVAMVAVEDWELGDLLRLVRQSDSYRDYPQRRLESALQVLSGYYPFARPLLDWDRAANRLTKRSNTAMAAVTGVGTIPQSGNYPVHHLESRAHLGELDEEFIQESQVGDVFQLGTSSWMIREIRNDRVYVAEAGNRFSEIPFWRNEAGSRPYELGLKVGVFVRELADGLGLEDETDEREKKERELADEREQEEEKRERELTDEREQGQKKKEREQADEREQEKKERELVDAACEWLGGHYGMDRIASEQLIELIRSQSRACALPTDRQIVIEHYRDVMNQTHVIVHNLCGRTVNRAWLLAIKRQFEQLLPYRLYGNAKDNGIEFVLPEWDASWLQAIRQVTPGNLELLLTEAISDSPLLGIAFRRIAENSLLLSRSFTRTPLWQKRLRSEELLRSALPYAESFPYLREAMSECLRDYLGIDQLREWLTKLVSGEVAVVVKETAYPSPLAAQFIADYVNMQVYEGDGFDESTRLRLLGISKEMAAQIFGGADLGQAVSPEVVESESRRMSDPEQVPANAADLASLLKRRGDLTSAEIVRLAGEPGLVWLGQLQEQGRASAIDLAGDGEFRWIAADEAETYAAFPETPESVLFVLGRYAEHVVSFTEAELCERYPALSLPKAREAVEELLDKGVIERAPHAVSDEERLWTSAKVASLLVRLSIRQARSKAEPIDPARWCGQIALRQHAWQGAQLQGSEGLLTVLERLQGLFLPLSHWETIVLPTRVTGYRKEYLDQLCASGELVWIGRKEEGDKEGKVAFFLTESRPLYAAFLEEAAGKPSRHPELLGRIEDGGASFLTRLSREEGKTPSELLPDLLDLAWEGRVSNDQFAPLRLQVGAAKPKQWERAGSGQGRWYATSSLLEGGGQAAEEGPGRPAPQKDSPVLVWTHHLLNVYGLINKELVAKTAPYSWEHFYPTLKKLEEWGALTRGSFVKGVSSLQFTTRELSESIRQPLPDTAEPSLAVLASADPAIPFGLLMDWPREEGGASYARKPGNFLVMQGERWLFWLENNGKRAFGAPGASEGQEEPATERQAAMLLQAFQAIIRSRKLVKIKVDSWNGRPILETDLGRRLHELGGERDMRSLVFWSK
ncbi:DEAD/DEAH box helicase [Cohnella cellulosilytica]|uniref:DEAD/DEAH box helicase n=1 Tax=Cohnella cellulosilytica TaxID=986710 RepID=A0ABW2F1H7_9BACL